MKKSKIKQSKKALAAQKRWADPEFREKMLKKQKEIGYRSY